MITIPNAICIFIAGMGLGVSIFEIVLLFINGRK